MTSRSTRRILSRQASAQARTSTGRFTVRTRSSSTTAVTRATRVSGVGDAEAAAELRAAKFAAETATKDAPSAE